MTQRIVCDLLFLAFMVWCGWKMKDDILWIIDNYDFKKLGIEDKKEEEEN